MRNKKSLTGMAAHLRVAKIHLIIPTMIILSLCGFYLWSSAHIYKNKLALNELEQEITTLIGVGDYAQVPILLEEFVQANDIKHIELVSADRIYSAGYVGHTNSEFVLAQVPGWVGDQGRYLIDRPIVIDGRSWGTLKSVWPVDSGLNMSPVFFVMVLMSAYLIYLSGARKKNLNKNISIDVVNNFADVDSNVFFEAAIKQMGLAIDYKEIPSFSVTKRVRSIHVNIAWGRDDGHLEKFTLSQLSGMVEQNKLILPIIPWVVRKMVIEIKNKFKIDKDCEFLIDVSGRQFTDINFIHFIKDLCRTIDLLPSSICVDIDESILIRLDESGVHLAWDAWTAAGFGVAISNFGKSSLSKNLLENFKIKKIKWNIAWLRHQWFSVAAKDRVLHLQAMALNAGVATLIEGALSDNDFFMIDEVNARFNFVQNELSTQFDHQDAGVSVDRENLKLLPNL